MAVWDGLDYFIAIRIQFSHENLNRRAFSHHPVILNPYDWSQNMEADAIKFITFIEKEQCDHLSKYLVLCSMDEGKQRRFVTT